MGYRKGLVSCVTPVYNGEKYLGAMLDSVLAQSYPYVEMILVDDGSQDRTLFVAESYQKRFADKGYAYRVIHAPHKNASAAINYGLLHVTGEYLIWPDSDDILEKESIKRRVRFLEEHPQYCCVRSVMYYFNGAGVLCGNGENWGDLEKEALFWDILYSDTFICCGCYMLKTEPFFSIYPDRRIPEYPVGQNFQMLLPYLYRHNCPTIPEKLYGVRVRADSHSRRGMTQKEEEDRFYCFEKLVDEIAKICKIRSIREKKRLLCWKLRRRCRLAQKWGKRAEAKLWRGLLLVIGGIRIPRIAKRFFLSGKSG